jgi:methylmalonyl-CoA mutase N-terminal domain/subunit
MIRTKQVWQNETLKKVKERRARFSTSSDIPLDVVHGDAEFPGEFPYTRGIHPTMYRSRFWTMRQYSGFASAQESNARYRYLLAHGQTGLSVAFDLPTQLCMDADDPLSEGEVGKVGVSISTLDDMRELFNEIPLDQVSTSMTINAPAAVLLALYIAVAKEQARAKSSDNGSETRIVHGLRGTVQNDILKEYAARGLYVFPPNHSMRLVTDVFAFCKEHTPQWNTISISGYHIREAGSTAVQEVAFTLANAIAYVQGALEAGLHVDDFAPQLAFFFNAHNDFLEEVAKYRAARRMWAKIMRDRFNAKDPRSWMLRFHTQTGGSTLTAQQPMNNIVRTTIQALASVMGGTQSLHTNGYDEALQLPTQEAARLALRTQQIIANEIGVTDTVDPLGGSHVIEYLTDEIEKRASELIFHIDSMGGAVKAIEAGWMQAQIAESAFRYQTEIEKKERIIVGVNEYGENEQIKSGSRFVVNEEVAKRQHERLQTWRAKRDANQASALMSQLERVARGSENIMPCLIACVEGGVTVGEIGKVLRKVFGEYRPPTMI